MGIGLLDLLLQLHDSFDACHAVDNEFAFDAVGLIQVNHIDTRVDRVTHVLNQAIPKRLECRGAIDHLAIVEIPVRGFAGSVGSRPLKPGF